MTEKCMAHHQSCISNRDGRWSLYIYNIEMHCVHRQTHISNLVPMSLHQSDAKIKYFEHHVPKGLFIEQKKKYPGRAPNVNYILCVLLDDFRRKSQLAHARCLGDYLTSTGSFKVSV